MVTKTNNMNTPLVRIRNKSYSHLQLTPTNNVKQFIEVYFQDPNCWPDTFTHSENELTELEKCSFVYHTLTDTRYNYNKFK